VAVSQAFPLIAPRSTELRMAHFDRNIYRGDTSTILYKLVDALCGSSGAGALVNQSLLARLSAAIDTMYFNELDYIFGKLSFLARSPSESYGYNPSSDMLTSDQWDEVRVKDAAFRARITGFFKACSLGSTPLGVSACVNAALSVEANIYEVWRYLDSWGLTAFLGRESSRNEIVVQPLKDSLAPAELRLIRDMLMRVISVDTIVTIDTDGLSVATPVPIAAAGSDSTYYQVEQTVISTPVLDKLPSPELLPVNLSSSEQWMFNDGTPTKAPYAAFNMTQESSDFYLMDGGTSSSIDSVIYGTLRDDGSVLPETNFVQYESNTQYTDWMPYSKADSPDNYPGGKYGQHPASAPAINPDGTDYVFPYSSQADYVDTYGAQVTAMGGIATGSRYRLPIVGDSQSKTVYLPQYAIAYTAPARDSTVSASMTQNRIVSTSQTQRDPAVFVRSTS